MASHQHSSAHLQEAFMLGADAGAVRARLDQPPLALLHRFLTDETGATAIEYCIIATAIALGIIAAVGGIGTNLKLTFTTINTQLK
jgi:pilus assembly protein Flp/PilA